MKKIYCLLVLSFFAFEGISQTVSKKKLEVLGQSKNNQRIKSPNSFGSRISTAVNDTTTAPQDDGKKMTFQGSLYREGEPFNGTANLGFSINLDSATTWSESIDDVTVINGLYSVVLGETSGIPSNLFDNANERTLSVTVDGETLGNVKLYAPFGAGGGSGSMIKDANGNVVGIFEADALGNGTLDISGTNQGSGEIQSFVKLNVISDSLNGESFQYGNMEFNNSIGTRNVLSTDGMRRYNDSGNQTAQYTGNSAGFNHVFPDGSTSPVFDFRRAGFQQMVGYDSTQNFGSFTQLGFNDNAKTSFLYMTDFNAVTDIGIYQGQGYLNLKGSTTDNIWMGGKVLAGTPELPYFQMIGEAEIQGEILPDSLGNLTDTTYYNPNLVWMEVQRWEDGTEIGSLTLSGTDGSEFSVNSHGVSGNQIQIGNGAEGTYTQQQKTAFRVKNDNDQFSAVHLSRFNDGQTRLQLTNHDSTGVAQATTFLGTNSNGGYLFINSAKVDGSGNVPMVDLYTTGNSPAGDLMDNGYKRSGVDFYDNDGSRLSALGSAKDTGGKSGLMFLWGENDVPNVEITGKRWDNADLPTMQLFGTTSDGNGWYSPNAVLEVNEDGGSQYGQLSLNKSNPNDSTSSGSTILLDGNSGNANFSGAATAAELKAGDYFGDNVGLYLNGNDGSMVASGDINSDSNINAVDGNFSGVLTSADGTVQSSDRRLKKDIASLDNALENTLKMRGVSYTWKDESKSQKNQIGVIAQEVEKVYPEFVVTKDDGMKAVNYAQMVAVLIEAVKELNSEIATLKAENSDLKAQAIKTAELSKRLDMIEKLLIQGGTSSTSIESE